METTNNIPYSIERRPIKYPRIEYKSGELQLILPFDKNEHEFYERHLNWIKKRENAIQAALEEAKGKTLLERNEEAFKILIQKYLNDSHKSLNTEIAKVFFREMKSKWASYSPNHNITVNKLMKYLPDHLIDYILYHEMAHGIQKKHNEQFWQIIQKGYPDHQLHEKELFSYWFLIQNLKADSKNEARD